VRILARLAPPIGPTPGISIRRSMVCVCCTGEQWCAEIDARGERCRLPFFAEMGVTELTDIQNLTKRRDKSLRGKPVTFASCGITLPGEPLPTESVPRAPHSARMLIRSSLPEGPEHAVPPPSAWAPSSARTWRSQRPSSVVPNSRRTHLAGAARLISDRPPPLSVLPPSSQSERDRAHEKAGLSRAPSSGGAAEKEGGKGGAGVGVAADSEFVGEWWKDGILKNWYELQKKGGVRPKTAGGAQARPFGGAPQGWPGEVKGSQGGAVGPANGNSRLTTAQKPPSVRETLGSAAGNPGASLGAQHLEPEGAAARASVMSRGGDSLQRPKSGEYVLGKPQMSGSVQEAAKQRPKTAVASTRHHEASGDWVARADTDVPRARRTSPTSAGVGRHEATPRRNAGTSGYSVRYAASVNGGESLKSTARGSGGGAGGKQGNWSDMLVREIVMRTMESQQSNRKATSGGSAAVAHCAAPEGAPRLSARSDRSGARPKTAGVLGRGASFLAQSERHVLRSVGAARDRKSRV